MIKMIAMVLLQEAWIIAGLQYLPPTDMHKILFTNVSICAEIPPEAPAPAWGTADSIRAVSDNERIGGVVLSKENAIIIDKRYWLDPPVISWLSMSYLVKSAEIPEELAHCLAQ